MPYQSIVFMQGDDANMPLDMLYQRESEDSIVYHGTTAESIAAAVAYLAQWDYGEPTEETQEPSNGSGDDVWEEDGYRLSASLSYGYIGLERIVLIREPGYFTCPCCGDVAIGDGREPLCGDCREAGCEATRDACGELGYWGCDRTDTDANDLTDRAAEIGREHGRSAASWVFDGNTSEDTYRRVLRGIGDGDPEVMDAYREPSLSGEFADDYTSSDLMYDLGAEALDTEYQDELCRAWEDAASEAFWHEIERIARANLT